MSETISENRFECLLVQRKYFDVWYHDLPDRKINKDEPIFDYYIRTLYSDMMVEVKEFGKTFNFLNHQIGTVETDVLVKRSRRQIIDASKQFKPYLYKKLPCLIVLDNWKGYPFITEDVILLQLWGEFGCPLINQNDNKHGWIHTNKRRPTLLNYPSISAISVIEEINPGKVLSMRLRIYHNPIATHPLPLDIFRTENDIHWKVDNNGQWYQVNT